MSNQQGYLLQLQKALSMKYLTGASQPGRQPVRLPQSLSISEENLIFLAVFIGYIHLSHIFT